jgi:hypothetical protein
MAWPGSIDRRGLKRFLESSSPWAGLRRPAISIEALMLRARVLLGLLAAFAGLGLGCGDSGSIKVTGKVFQSKEGVPLKDFPPKTGRIEMILQPVVEKGKNFTTYPGRVMPDLTFEINNVPAGKYKIVLSLSDAPGGPDKLGKKFSEANTKLVQDIKDSTPLEIDLSQ